MKVAISVPDELFTRGERTAKRQDKSRSELYADALREYLARREPNAITAALDEVVRDLDEESERDEVEFLQRAARSALRETSR